MNRDRHRTCACSCAIFPATVKQALGVIGGSAALLFTGVSPASTIIAEPLLAQEPAAVTRAAATITPDDLARHVAIIAADSMLGRATPSRGLEQTARYVAAQFQRAGLKPGGDNGGWLQRYPIPLDSTMAPPTAASVTAANTIGILEGSDAKLKGEYVVIVAHMDGKGVDPMAGDSIFNGADDNASGTAGVIALARAFSQPGARPRRSLIFLTVGGGETTGGTLLRWGSRYFNAHPPVPARQIVAALELDMIGRNWPTRIAVIGKKLSNLGATLDRVAAAHPELDMAPVDDAWLAWSSSAHVRGAQNLRIAFRLSDQYAFAHRGIPSLRFWDMGHPDTGQATDDAVVLDADKASRVVQLVFYVAHAIANATKRPQWNPAVDQAAIARDSLPALPLQP